MTQLFDTHGYEDRHETDASSDAARHLRSMPTGHDFVYDPAHEIGERTTQWRLDETTIETGRKGIQAARKALQEAARATPTKRARRAA